MHNVGDVSLLLRDEYTNLVERMLALNAKVEGKLKLLEEKEWQRRELYKWQKGVQLDVGGVAFASSKDVFLRGLADRNPQNLERILMSMRTGCPMDFANLPVKQAEQLQDDADYYDLVPKVSPPLIRWDTIHCAPNLAITGKGLNVTKTGGSTGWTGVFAAAPDAASFTVRLDRLQKCVRVGYVTAFVLRTGFEDYNRIGRFLDTSTGHIHSCSDHGNHYTAVCGQNDCVTAHFDKTLRTIAFEINGAKLEVAFSEIDCGEGPLFPAINILTCGDSFSLAPDVVPRGTRIEHPLSTK